MDARQEGRGDTSGSDIDVKFYTIGKKVGFPKIAATSCREGRPLRRKDVRVRLAGFQRGHVHAVD